MSSPRWTDEEIAILRANRTMTGYQLCRLLPGRSPAAIKHARIHYGARYMHPAPSQVWHSHPTRGFEAKAAKGRMKVRFTARPLDIERRPEGEVFETSGILARVGRDGVAMPVIRCLGGA